MFTLSGVVAWPVVIDADVFIKIGKLQMISY